MSQTNEATIASYDAHIQEYIDGTPHEMSGVVKEWLDSALSALPKNARIFEIGSAFGRDARYMQSLGFEPECSDATPGFVRLLHDKGLSAREFNVITDEFTDEYDLIVANAVFLHLTRDEMSSVLAKTYDALTAGGRLAFTLKQGEGENWSDDKLGAPRYFCYWTKELMRGYLEGAGFVHAQIIDDAATEKTTWLQAIAQKENA
jgi:predicted TPR repeat methyltransferase